MMTELGISVLIERRAGWRDNTVCGSVTTPEHRSPSIQLYYRTCTDSNSIRWPSIFDYDALLNNNIRVVKF